MFTEIVKIIEGGINGDAEKVFNYASVLVENLNHSGETKLANRIAATLQRKRGGLASLDSFAAKPVDAESRMDIVEVSLPAIAPNKIVLNKYVEGEINGFVDGYRKRDLFLKAGLEVSNSLLLYGPPGCGKTTVAKFISSIMNLPLVTAKLDGLVSSLLGSTAKNIRKIFDYASKRECILFLDEFDVIAKLRDDKNELGELKRVVNSLIQNIDSFSNNNILICATNHHKLLDPAIWRRFNKIISLEKPSLDEIQELLKLTLQEFSPQILGSRKRLEQVSAALLGQSHSDIRTIVENSAKQAIIHNRKELKTCEIFKEIFFFKNHNIGSEESLIEFLLSHKVSHIEINECLEIPLRKIQSISKSAD